MTQWQWFVGGMMALSIGLTGCGSVASNAQTSSHSPASIVTQSNTSLGKAPVHITVQQKQGHLTVHIATPQGVSKPEAAKLQNAVQQLNQLLQQLQNP